MRNALHDRTLTEENGDGRSARMPIIIAAVGESSPEGLSDFEPLPKFFDLHSGVVKVSLAAHDRLHHTQATLAGLERELFRDGNVGDVSKLGDGLRTRAHMQFFVDAADMRVYGRDTNAQ